MEEPTALPSSTTTWDCAPAWHWVLDPYYHRMKMAPFCSLDLINLKEEFIFMHQMYLYLMKLMGYKLGRRQPWNDFVFKA